MTKEPPFCLKPSWGPPGVQRGKIAKVFCHQSNKFWKMGVNEVWG